MFKLTIMKNTEIKATVTFQFFTDQIGKDFKEYVNCGVQ